jgi:hypothetical protein
MTQALTSLDPRLNPHVDLIASGRFSRRGAGVFPSYFDIFRIFSQRPSPETDQKLPKYRERLAGQFSFAPPFMAIV